MILCDTNILIEFYKNTPDVVGELRNIGQDQLAISVITQAELYFGARNKTELGNIKQHLALLDTISIETAICENFIILMEQYSLSHKLAIPDALIASTALVFQQELYTLNLKDFRFIAGLKLYEAG